MSQELRSPFFIVEHCISPSTCEQLIQDLGILPGPPDEANHIEKNERILRDGEHALYFKELMQRYVSEIEERYNGTVVGMEPPTFSQYFENPKEPCQEHGCENAQFLRKKWVKTKDVDLVGYIWLKDFNSGIPLDPRFETYGGKLEFPAYDFSIVPQRGTLILYPAGPHFITAISPVLVGSLEQIKITVKMKSNDGSMWLYQPANFPGTYQEWFATEE